MRKMILPDIHETLLPFKEVYAFVRKLDTWKHPIPEIDLFKYCIGFNTGNRPIFQIYSKEFIEEISNIINKKLNGVKANAPILEVMCGDGKLSEFLKPLLKKKLIATDTKEWTFAIGEHKNDFPIPYPEWVIEIDAIKAIKKFEPSIVILCWEPTTSKVALEIIKMGIPLMWIGEGTGGCCGKEEIFKYPHEEIYSKYNLCRTDHSFGSEWPCSHTGIYLFNW